MKNFEEFLTVNHINFDKNADTSRISYIRSGGTADYIVYPDNENKVIILVDYLTANSIKYKILGKCSNCVFSDTGFSGVIVSTLKLNRVTLNSNCICFGAGVFFKDVAIKLMKRGISLFPELYGIPASIGGMVKNNAGAFGKEVKDCFHKCRLYDAHSKKIFEVSKENMKFSYRHSLLSEDSYILLNADFFFSFEETKKIEEEFNFYRKERLDKQPREPSLGSFYKRDKEIIPAKIIDYLGLKGYSVGGAAVSEKHAGFIVNKGNAKFRDIETLADYIEKTVKDKTGIVLKREAELIY